MKFWIMAVIAPGVMAIADSVWDQAETNQHAKQVFVKGLSVDGDQVVVTVVSADKDDQFRETVELCSSSPGGELINSTELIKSDLIQQAFNQGRVITVQFSGTFNRCISKVKAMSDVPADESTVKI